MLFPSVGSPSFPLANYPAPRQTQPYRSPQPVNTPAPPVWNPTARAQLSQPRVTVRAQIGEDPSLGSPATPSAGRQIALSMPAPEQFGIRSPRESSPGPIDWPAVQDRLARLAAT